MVAVGSSVPLALTFHAFVLLPGLFDSTTWPAAGVGDISSRGQNPQTISLLGLEGTGTLSEEATLVWLLVLLVCSGSFCRFVPGFWYIAGHWSRKAIGVDPQLHTWANPGALTVVPFMDDPE